MNKLETKTPAISIIVPVYQVETYLKRCLDSLSAQIMQDFEVILIYTQSTDCSLEILQKYCETDFRFKLFYNTGHGVSSARNVGLSAAQGEYIAFVDSDDYVEPQYLQRLYDTARNADADISCCNYYACSYNTKPRPHALPISNGIYNSRILLKTLIRDHRLQFYLWNKLWKHCLFTEHNVSFTDMCFEDCPVNVELFYHANCVAVITEPLYYYEKRDGSLVSHITIDKINDYLLALFSIRNFLMLKNDYSRYRCSFLLHCNRILLTTLQLIYHVHTEEHCFNGMFANFKNTYRAVFYCAGKCFTPIDNFSDFPSMIQEPRTDKH